MNFKSVVSNFSNITAKNKESSYDEEPDYRILPEVVPIAVVIVLVNSLVFYLFTKQKNLRTPTNCLLLSLAVCDFLTGFVGIPSFIAVVVRAVKPPAAAHFGTFNIIFNNAMAITAAYHILTITLERYFSILKPFIHRQLTKKSMFKVALLVWFVSTVIAVMPYAWSSREFTNPIGFRKTQFGYVVFCLVFVFFIPCILIVVSQILMFKTISKRGIHRLSSRAVNQRKARNEKKCLIIFALMAVIYLTCWLPWFVLFLYFSLWFPLSIETMEVLSDLAQVFAIFRFLTSVVNPVLYTFFKRDFFDAFKRLILRKKTSKQNATVAYASQGKTLVSSPVCCGDVEKFEYMTVL